MKRVLALALIVLHLGGVRVAAAEPASKTLREAITRAVAAVPQATTAPRATVRAPVRMASALQPSTQQQKKSFWKSPWPYVIAGAAVAVIIGVAASGDGYSSSSPGEY